MVAMHDLINNADTFTKQIELSQDVYNQCQHDIKCKQAHKAGMLAGEYYSDEYKAAYRAVLNV